MIYNDGIKKGISDRLSNNEIARKIYLSFPTNVFVNAPELQFEIINEIRSYFRLAYLSVQVIGSSKTGFSYHQNKNFIKGESDLDIAIIDQQLFLYYTEEVFQVTRGFRNLTKFGRNEEGISHYQLYSNRILRGIFRPDFMPTCDLKRDWFNFFNKLSQKHISLFSNINAGIYLNEYYFEEKQSQIVDFYKKM